jgi:hypothetical protein
MFLPKLEKNVQGLTSLSDTYFEKAQVANIFTPSKVWHIATVSSLSESLRWFHETSGDCNIQIYLEKDGKASKNGSISHFTAGGLGGLSRTLP